MPTSFFSHERALVETSRIGARTRIWAFAHILPGAVIGEDCNVCDGVFIENDVIVGNRVTLKCGVQLWDGIRLGDDVFVGPNATFTNDPAPRSKIRPKEFVQTVVREGASIGANATILPGVTIGAHSMVGAGAVVTRSVPPYAVVVGNPARIVRYVEDDNRPSAELPRPPSIAAPSIRVEGVQVLPVPQIRDLRGSLVAREFGNGCPFVPNRSFVVFDVATKEVRGEHAHHLCEQLLVCLKGSVRVLCDDGAHRQEFDLTSPTTGLYVPPLVWAAQYRYTEDAILMVLASHPYDSKDYVRDYDEFLRIRSSLVRP